MTELSAQTLGGIAALGSGAAWALGSVLFRSLADKTSALGLNFAKGLLGLVYLGLALCWVGLVPMDLWAILSLSLSGLVGIALGDTLFFMALVRLEPRRTVLLATVGQALTVVLALVVLGERPTAWSWAGILTIIAGVSWVMMEQSEHGGQSTRSGLLLGLGAAACMSVGIILAKLGMAEVPALQATAVRMAAGMGGLLLVGLSKGSLIVWLRPLWNRPSLLQLAWADVVIIGGGFYLSMLALELIDATLASVLCATEPLFVLPLAVWLLHERLSPRAIGGALVAVVGVALILAGG
jgi:drug/metabolite transporter (DMT)-like permease